LIRLFLRLFGIKDFEPCQSCETLKQQLAYVRDDNLRLTNTLLDIVKPKTYEAPPVELNQIAQSSALFSRRRAALEERDRQQAAILKQSKNLGKPDGVDINSSKSIDELEKELQINEGA
jgi:hypothetical protein